MASRKIESSNLQFVFDRSGTEEHKVLLNLFRDTIQFGFTIRECNTRRVEPLTPVFVLCSGDVGIRDAQCSKTWMYNTSESKIKLTGSPYYHTILPLSNKEQHSLSSMSHQTRSAVKELKGNDRQLNLISET